MSLKIGKKTTRKSKIEAVEPLDYENSTTHTFDVELEVIPKSRWDKMFQSDQKPSDTDILKTTLKNLEGLVDDNGQPVKFDDDVKLKVLDEPWVAAALIEEQISIQQGKTGSEYRRLKLKN